MESNGAIPEEPKRYELPHLTERKRSPLDICRISKGSNGYRGRRAIISCNVQPIGTICSCLAVVAVSPPYLRMGYRTRSQGEVNMGQIYYAHLRFQIPVKHRVDSFSELSA
jgi:hypothetical protein